MYHKLLTIHGRRSHNSTALSRQDGQTLLGVDLEATFAAPNFYAKPRAEIFDLETQLKTARDKVAHLYARWHELELLQSVPYP
jgi:hypothetical protein